MPRHPIPAIVPVAVPEPPTPEPPPPANKLREWALAVVLMALLAGVLYVIVTSFRDIRLM